MNDADNPNQAPIESITPLKVCLQAELEHYFNALGDQHPSDLYKMVIGEAEQALLGIVMQRTRNNQSKAAEILNINRGTLRKKLKMYGLER
ncbi:MAG: helix-turn-helix domain-containing protein [Gammaproteobacteria bacterium]|nr:helix-turn-helix domain-containing protein [Gammaproteobacteria bacterium]